MLLDKPGGITSLDAVKRVQRLVGAKRAGHCGTLDPLATGLLIVCLDKATKLAQFVLGESKSYEAEAILGYSSDTYDRNGQLTRVTETVDVSSGHIEEVLRKYRGTIEQRPPRYSALKLKGKPLYDYARRNIEVEPETRQVTISELELVEFELPRLKLRVDCSAGTYVRSLVNDIGNDLGCGAYLHQLRRLRVGDRTVGQSLTLEEVEQLAKEHRIEEAVIPLDRFLSLASVTIRGEKASRVPNGVDITAADITDISQAFAARQLVALRDPSGDLLAVGRSLLDSTYFSGGNGSRVIEYVRVI
jgi:tRNA pseudouridine55 synthase